MKNTLTGLNITRLALCIAVVSILTACSLKEIKQQAETVENFAFIEGNIDTTLDSSDTIHVVLFEKQDLTIVRVESQVLSSAGTYRFGVPTGTYSVGAYIDSNNDNEYQEGEPAVYYGLDSGDPKFVNADVNSMISIEPMTIRGAVKKPEGLTVENNMRKSQANLGEVVSLDNVAFSHDVASEGLWRPVDFAIKYGGGLMMLQDYEAGKVPVIFIHGIGGTPREFEHVIARLDREKYQPWILHFPSGARLHLISDYLVRALNTLRSDYPFTEVAIVAHSMGGLVTRSYVKKYTESHQPYLLKFVATINSPLMGMDSAVSGVEHSPIVIPAWRDVATNSAFIQDLHAWTWPESVPYYLVFSYLEGEEGDGVVPVRQQLTLKLQDEAVSISGYEAGHAKVLSHEDFLERFPAMINSL